MFEWRRRAGEENRHLLCPAAADLLCTSMADSDKARVSRIVQLLENGGRAQSGQATPSGVVEREVRQRGESARTIWRSGCSAAPLDKLRIPSRHGTMAAVCGIVVTLHRQTNGCRSRAAVGSTSSATAGYWLLRVCSRNSWLGLFRLHLRFRNVL